MTCHGVDLIGGTHESSVSMHSDWGPVGEPHFACSFHRDPVVVVSTCV